MIKSDVLEDVQITLILLTIFANWELYSWIFDYYLFTDKFKGPAYINKLRKIM